MTWPRPLLFGHRGAPATGTPENTMASFARALADGAGALETDVHATVDGHIVVSHDPIANGLEIRATARDRLALPLLRDVLDAFAVPVNVDIKQRDPPIERAVVDAIGNDAGRVLLASFHSDALARVRQLAYAGPTGLSRDEIVRVLTVPVPILRALSLLHGVRAQVPRSRGRRRFDTRRFVDKCHALGVAVDYWVINDVDEAKTLLALGADGIMSDAPALVAPAFPRP